MCVCVCVCVLCMHVYKRERERVRDLSYFDLHLQLKEVFGAGTACVVCPVNRILYLDEVHVHVCYTLNTLSYMYNVMYTVHVHVVVIIMVHKATHIVLASSPGPFRVFQYFMLTCKAGNEPGYKANVVLLRILCCKCAFFLLIEYSHPYNGHWC